MLAVEDVSVRFGPRWVLQGADLAVRSNEVVGLLGPSGSGKSTLLRVIAGLLPPDAGRVRWNGEDVTQLPTHRRRFGLVFQDHQLFPHRDVGANVGFGLAVAGRPKAEVRARVAELLELVGLKGFEHRAVGSLSGGEAQRVALARALAPRPRLLLLDEPLGALDRELHDRLAVELRALLKQVGIAGVHVTHDRGEAEMVADRVLTMDDLHARVRPSSGDGRFPESGGSGTTSR